jgi:hypothetical protein
MPVDSLQKQEGRDAEGRFEKGVSGNPAGRPRGARNRATEAAELLLEGEAERLTRKAVECALDGVRPVRGAADLGDTMAAIATAATGGEITPGEAAELARVVEIFVRAVETSDFERRLRQPEDRRDAGA